MTLSGVDAAPLGTAAGQAAVLRGLSLTVAEGEAVAVIGPSGAGKTTLLQLLACALRPSAGQYQVGACDPWRLGRSDLQALRGKLFLAPQVPPLPPRQRVVTAVLAGCLPAWSLLRSLRSLVYPSDIAAAHAALASFDLEEKLFERVDRLSGGERQRVGLARALVTPAQLWLMDEPLSALDPLRTAQAAQTLIQEARRRGVTLLASLHHVEMALAHFPRIVGLREGQVLFDLPAPKVSPALLAQLYAQHEEELHGGVPDSADSAMARPALLSTPCR
ncbi:ATP-binding cassette domain-containing protein [Paucibacter sp. B2R-40]|nr:ATP-binding cassette domain-containing protein [Paucibacter sp. B2R-40]MCV2354064.1 ATP-binding cassette domain-containing protein [Paucibacter sp. B2R-40]